MASKLARVLAVWFPLACAATAAEDVKNEIHLWTDASGRFSVQAEFVRAEYDQEKKASLVYLKKPDGTIIPVPFESLSPPSKDLAVRLQAGRGANPSMPGPKAAKTAKAAPSDAAVGPARKSGKPAFYAYALPFKNTDCGGFCAAGNTLFVFDFPNRSLLGVQGDRFAPMDSMQGWHVSDVTMAGRVPHYCSRGRMLSKVQGKVREIPVAGATDLISIAASDAGLFLLDAASRQILQINAGYSVGRQFACPGRRPRDLAYHGGFLWVLDDAERCVRKVDPRTGQVAACFQAGFQTSSAGIVFLGDQLYVHEADFARLRHLPWTEDGPAVYSCPQEFRFRFVQESWNKSEDSPCQVRFRVPVPPDTPYQKVESLEWSTEPTELVSDRFQQPVASFTGITIPPSGHHVLEYRARVNALAVQYRLDDVPLSELDQIPEAVRSVYLGHDPHFDMDEPAVQQAAEQARKNSQGNAPSGVRSLIENIVAHVTGRLEYVMDDTWDTPAKVLPRGTGSCSEYSLVFSALARLNGIPTRLVGGVLLRGDYAAQRQTEAFHRWTEVWFPKVGWVPVDVTLIDSATLDSYDYEFLFGLPGYSIVLSRGGIDDNVLGLGYHIHRLYQGGKRERKTYVVAEPSVGNEEHPIVTLR